MKNTIAKTDKNVVRGKVKIERRIGHLTQTSRVFRSKKWYNRKEGKSVD